MGVAGMWHGADLLLISSRQVCDSNGNSLSGSISIWEYGIDLHAVDGMYHGDCCNIFMSHRRINSAHSHATQVDASDLSWSV